MEQTKTDKAMQFAQALREHEEVQDKLAVALAHDEPPSYDMVVMTQHDVTIKPPEVRVILFLLFSVAATASVHSCHMVNV